MSDDSGGTEHETSPPLSDFDPWKIGQPDDGIAYLYKSAVDGFWRIIKDEDHALEEATNYPVGELIEHEMMGDYDDSESGELRAIFVPPAEDGSEQDGSESHYVESFAPRHFDNTVEIWCPELDETKVVIGVRYVRHCPMCGHSLETATELNGGESDGE